MPSVSSVSQSSAAHFSNNLNDESQQTHSLNQKLNETRNAAGGIGLERSAHREPPQKLTQLNEKLLESRNINQDTKEGNESRILSQAKNFHIQHDQSNTINTVKTQAKGIGQLDAPSRILNTKGPVSIGDAQRVARSVLTVLERAYPKDAEKLKPNRELFELITKMEPREEYSNKDLHVFYSFFKRAENITSQLGVLNKQSKENVDNMDLSRIMKWHFRCSLTTQVKEALDLKLNERLAYIEQGGSRSNEIGIKYTQSLDPVGVVNASMQVGNKQTFSITPTGEVKSSSDLEVSVGVGLFSGLAELGLSFGTTETKKYSTLADYVSANSAKLNTWFAESKFVTAASFSEIIKLASNYDNDILYTHMSRPFLLDKLSALKLSDMKIDPPQRGVRPTEVHYTHKKSVSGQASLNCFVELSGKLNISQETGTKNKCMDLIDMMASNKAVAVSLIKDKASLKDGSALVQSLQNHVKLHSNAFTTAVLREKTSTEARATLANCKNSAAQILADYVASKAANKVDATSESIIQKMLSEHSMLLRPDSLRVYDISTPIKRNVCSASASVSGALKLLEAKAEMKLISVIEHDDPHCGGEFVELELAGEIKTMDGLNMLVNKLLDSMGKPNPSLATLSSSLGSAALHQSHGISSQSLIKIKDGVPLMLIQQTFNNVSDNTSATIPTTLGSSLKLSGETNFKTLQSETLGVQTLDFILPIARKKIKDIEHSDGWDTYVDAHINDFKKLIQNIAELQSFPSLKKDIENISQTNTEAKSLCTSLINSAAQARKTPIDKNYEAALVHLKGFLTHYISTDYNQKIQEKWDFPKPK